jgi:hypothetical protein
MFRENLFDRFNSLFQSFLIISSTVLPEKILKDIRRDIDSGFDVLYEVFPYDTPREFGERFFI